MARFEEPKTEVTFTFKLRPQEVMDMTKELQSLMATPDSRPIPNDGHSLVEGYVHNIGASLSPTLRNLFQMVIIQGKFYTPDPEQSP